MITRTLNSTWPFTVSVIACTVFLIFTSLAMVFYPGGTLLDPTIRGYSFWMNALSDMGMTRVFSKVPNRLSSVLFTLGLGSAGVGLGIFFMAFARFFKQTTVESFLGRSGAFLGVLAGIAFVGVAATPADLFLQSHLWFVNWAFQLFTLATLCFTICIMLSRCYPRGDGLILAGFTVLLISYVMLLNLGPSMDTPRGLMIMVAGQKVIAYASVISVLILALRARQFVVKNASLDDVPA